MGATSYLCLTGLEDVVGELLVHAEHGQWGLEDGAKLFINPDLTPVLGVLHRNIAQHGTCQSKFSATRLLLERMLMPATVNSTAGLQHSTAAITATAGCSLAFGSWHALCHSFCSPTRRPALPWPGPFLYTIRAST